MIRPDHGHRHPGSGLQTMCIRLTNKSSNRRSDLDFRHLWYVIRPQLPPNRPWPRSDFGYWCPSSYLELRRPNRTSVPDLDGRTLDLSTYRRIYTPDTQDMTSDLDTLDRTTTPPRPYTQKNTTGLQTLTPSVTPRSLKPVIGSRIPWSDVDPT